MAIAVYNAAVDHGDAKFGDAIAIISFSRCKNMKISKCKIVRLGGTVAVVAVCCWC